MSQDTRNTPSRLPSFLLWSGLAVVLISLLGYGTFGRHPQWLTQLPDSVRSNSLWFYQISFRLFGEGQTWFLIALLFVYMTHKVRAAWVLPMVLVYALSLGSEMAGTNYGFPFGNYSYSHLMGYKLAGHVPMVIPMSWFMIAVPSYALAHHTFPTPRHWGRRLLLGAFFITLWDVSLDPAMAYPGMGFITTYWKWEPAGAFYTMPLINWFGWYVTSLVIIGAMMLLRVERWISQLSIVWLRRYYMLNLLVPFGMIVLAGLWPAVALNVFLYVLSVVALSPSLRARLGWQGSSAENLSASTMTSTPEQEAV